MTDKAMWVNIFRNTTTGEAKYKCSICGSVRREKYNFCPDCGANMREKCENNPKNTTEKCETDFPKDYSYGY